MLYMSFSIKVNFLKLRLEWRDHRNSESKSKRSQVLEMICEMNRCRQRDKVKECMWDIRWGLSMRCCSVILQLDRSGRARSNQGEAEEMCRVKDREWSHLTRGWWKERGGGTAGAGTRGVKLKNGIAFCRNKLVEAWLKRVEVHQGLTHNIIQHQLPDWCLWTLPSRAAAVHHPEGRSPCALT